MKTVIIPKRNEKDLEDVPKHVRQGLHLVFAETMDDVLPVALRGFRMARPPRSRAGRVGRTLAINA
jgi:ATP-dependent Lon protease